MTSRAARWLGVLAVLASATAAALFSSNTAPPQVARGFAPSQRITLDGRGAGRVFDGMGAMSDGSRLLYDYPEPERSQILDYLFRPGAGASLQLLKVQIGSDANSTILAEPSHMRSPGTVDCHRGIVWWLMQQARARSPQIKFYGLMWTAPGWFRGGLWSPDMIHYILAWLGCAEQNGVPVSYIGGADERYDAPPPPSFFIALAHALKTSFPGVQVVATDDHTAPDYWLRAKSMLRDAAYRAAVGVVGEHDICGWTSVYTQCYGSQAALALGKPLWDSEQDTQSITSGGVPLARADNRGYIEARVTGTIDDPVLDAYYGDTWVAGHGLVLAEWPWSGYYQVSPSLWVIAQTTDFARPGWRYIDSASGFLSNHGSYVTLRSTGGDYSVVIETVDATSAEEVTLAPSGGLSRRPVRVWSTNVRSANPREWFVHNATLRLRGGVVRIEVRPGFVYTITTTSGQHKLAAATPSTASATTMMPVPYHQDFEQTGRAVTAPYFEDLQGAFEARPCAAGRSGTCDEQVITRSPVPWHAAKLPPTTIVGDPRWWGAYEVSVDAMLEQPGRVELLGRVDSYDQNEAGGYHFQVVSSGAWELYSEDSVHTRTLLASGSAAFGIGSWHRLAMVFSSGMLTAELDGQPLATVAATAHTAGQVGMAVIPWRVAQFDNLSVVPTAPWPRFVPAQAMTATATSQQDTVYFWTTHPAQEAVRDRPESCWMSRLVPGPAAPLPQAITVRLNRAQVVDGLSYRAPVGQQGVVTRYAVYLSRDGKQFWLVAGGAWRDEPAVTEIATWRPQLARFVRLTALRAIGDVAEACDLQVALTPLHPG